MGRVFRLATAVAAGAFVFAMAAANFGETGAIVGAVFGLSAIYLAYEVLTRRAEAQLTREKWKNYE